MPCSGRCTGAATAAATLTLLLAAPAAVAADDDDDDGVVCGGTVGAVSRMNAASAALMATASYTAPLPPLTCMLVSSRKLRSGSVRPVTSAANGDNKVVVAIAAAAALVVDEVSLALAPPS